MTVEAAPNPIQRQKGFQPLRISLSISLRIEIFPRNRIDHPRKGVPGIYRSFRFVCGPLVAFASLPVGDDIPFNPPWNSNPVQSEMRSNVGSLISENSPSCLVLPRHVRIKEQHSLAKNGCDIRVNGGREGEGGQKKVERGAGRRVKEEKGRQGEKVLTAQTMEGDGYSILFVS